MAVGELLKDCMFIKLGIKNHEKKEGKKIRETIKSPPQDNPSDLPGTPTKLCLLMINPVSPSQCLQCINCFAGDFP